MSIYYRYAPDGSIVFVLCYVDECVYWYTSEALVKWFVDTLRNIFHVKLLGYAHWFTSIRISHMNNHYISVDQYRYATSIVEKYFDTATFKASKKFYKTTLTYDMIFIKSDASTSDVKVENLTREFNIHYRACIGSFIYVLSTCVELSFCSKQVSKVFFKPS